MTDETIVGNVFEIIFEGSAGVASARNGGTGIGSVIFVGDVRNDDGFNVGGSEGLISRTAVASNGVVVRVGIFGWVDTDFDGSVSATIQLNDFIVVSWVVDGSGLEGIRIVDDLTDFGSAGGADALAYESELFGVISNVFAEATEVADGGLIESLGGESGRGSGAGIFQGGSGAFGLAQRSCGNFLEAADAVINFQRIIVASVSHWIFALHAMAKLDSEGGV